MSESDPKPILHVDLPTIEVADAQTLDLLFLDATASGCLLVRLGPTMAVVDAGRFEALATRLRKLGHLPRVEG